MNPDLYGLGIDATIPGCRSLIWDQFLKPRYADQGVSAYWLDETDGEGSNTQKIPGSTKSGGDGPWTGYDTSYGPAVAYNNLWVNDWLSIFSDPIAKLGIEPPLILTRGVWAGGQRHGAVLWSSDILSSFEELAAMIPQGVHTSLWNPVLDHGRRWLLPQQGESFAVYERAHRKVVPVWSLLPYFPYPRLPHLWKGRHSAGTHVSAGA